MSKANGGPAFPDPIRARCDGGSGMSLRDWFAGQAISAVIRQCAMDLVINKDDRNPEKYFAEKAFAVADAMLAEREK